MAKIKEYLAAGGSVLSLLDAAIRWLPSVITVLGLSGLSGWSAAVSEPFRRYAPFSWVIAAGVGALLGVLVIWLWAAARSKQAFAQLMLKESLKSDRINIVENTFTRCKVDINDFRLPISKPHQHKIFNECLITGPANIVCTNVLTMTRVQLVNCDYVLLKRDASIYNAIPFEDLTIAGGLVTGVTFLVPRDGHEDLLSQPGANWITTIAR